VPLRRRLCFLYEVMDIVRKPVTTHDATFDTICELPKQTCAYWAFLLQISNHLTNFHKPLHEAGSLYFTPPLPHGATAPPVGQGLLVIEASRSRSYTPHSVGLLWTSDQPDTETYTLQHTTYTKDRHPCPRRDSNSQPQQASRRKPRGHRDRLG